MFAPGATDVSTDIEAGPVVGGDGDRNRSRHRRLPTDWKISGERRTGCERGERHTRE